MIKDLLVNIPVGASSAPVAGLRGVGGDGLRRPPWPAWHLPTSRWFPGTVFDGVAASIIATYRAESEKAGQAAVAKFDETVRRAGMSAESHLLEAGPTGAGELFAQMARHFDLAVVAQTDPGEGRAGRTAARGRAVRLRTAGSRRALYPEDRAEARSGHGLLGRQPRRGARDRRCHAVPGAFQIDRCRHGVEGCRGRATSLPGFDIAHHLARHKLKVDLKRIVASDIDVPSALLSHAADTGADLIVMGGYGHSRLREFVLGGATRGILESMTVPVLMSH